MNVAAPFEAAAGHIVVAYCTTFDDAKAAVAEMVRDAATAGGYLGLDIETMALPIEIERSQALLLDQARIRGRLKAAMKTKAPASELEELTAERKVVDARVKYVGMATLDPCRARIRLAQLYGGGRRVAVLDVLRIGEEALALLNDCDVTIHNAAFELKFLEARGVELGEVHCSLQMARLLLGEHGMSLEAAAKAFFGLDLDKTQQTSDWSAPHLSRAQIEYAGFDAVVAFRLAEVMLPRLGGQAPAYEIQVAAIPAVARMESRGFRLDLAAHAELVATLKAQRVEACAAYQQACVDAGHPDLAAKVPSAPKEKRTALTAILSSEELTRWKRTPKSGALSTARNDLRRAAGYPPIAALVTLSQLDKVLSSFGTTLAVFASSSDSRIHAHYLVAATTSGRASCSKPNIQQSPRDKAFRALFVAGPGNVLIGCDYASMELRAAAHVSGDRRMTAAFENGEDLHRLTAAAIAHKRPEDVTSEERQAAKPLNFGAVYGLGAPGLVSQAWDEYGLVITLEEARQWLATFEQAYPDFARWRRVHANRCEMQRCIVIGRDALKGVGRYYPLSRLPPGKNVYTRACNLPIQGICADCSMLALTAIDRLLFEEGIDGGPVAWLHDEIILEVKAEDAERAAELLKRAMTEAFEERFPGAPLVKLVEARIGADWAAVKG
jgi:DNA polymerase-1